MSWTARDRIDVISHLADIKEDLAHLMLAVAALTELLVAKGIISERELAEKAAEIDAAPAGVN